MTALYNEIEPYAAAWLRNLSDAGHIAPGSVDVRSIAELRATDLVGVRQFHTFAGIGAWSHALRLAGWPDDEPVWTGSCPCQPFSDAGKGAGFDDPRHLWPEWFRLIRECRPPVVFGEQVASGAGLDWLAAVRADLEGEGYAVGAADLCAAGVGAPHIRQRIFFGAVRVADAERVDGRREHGHGLGSAARGDQGEGDQRERLRAHPSDGSAVGDVAHSGRSRLPAREREAVRGEGWGCEGGAVEQCGGASRAVADTDRRRDDGAGWRPGRWAEPSDGGGPLAIAGPWADCAWLPCRDGKARPTQPGLLPLAHGAPARVGRLRAYGNAIVPHAAAAFVRAFVAAVEEQMP